MRRFRLAIVFGLVLIAIGFVGNQMVVRIETGPRLGPQTESDSIDQAFRAFKLKYGAFPPNFSDRSILRDAWEKMFPYAVETPPENLNAAEALVFWLQGFTHDRRLPITGEGERFPFFPFHKDRLMGEFPHQVYVAEFSNGNSPLIYFDASRSYPIELQYQHLHPYTTTASAGEKLVNENRFQIIHPGADGNFGTGGQYPSGTGFSEGDFDNLTNFSHETLGNTK